MNYSNNPNHVRVDIFTENGKWYDTLEIVYDETLYNENIYDSFKIALLNKIIKNKSMIGSKDLREYLYTGMIVICLNPYNYESFPIMMHIDKIIKGN